MSHVSLKALERLNSRAFQLWPYDQDFLMLQGGLAPPLDRERLEMTRRTAELSMRTL